MDGATRTLLNSGITQIAAAQGQLEELKQRFAEALISTRHQVSVPGQGDWFKDQIETMYHAIERRQPIVKMLDLLAEHAGEEVTYAEVLERTGLGTKHQGNEIAAFSKTLNGLFGSKARPFENWQSSYSGSDGTMRYRMPEKIADWWLELRRSR